MANIESEDYYEILGVSKSANIQEIEKAYKKLAIKYHPDRNPPEKKEECHKIFQKIGEATSVLKDKDQREIYDKYGKEGLKNGGMGGFNPEDFFSQMFGGAGININDFFGGRFKQNQQKRQNKHVEPLKLTLEQVFSGVDIFKSIKYSTTCFICNGMGSRDVETCNECNGRGVVVRVQQIAPGFVSQSQMPCGKCNSSGKICKSGSKCDNCNGNKQLDHTKSINIKFPPGVREKQAVSFELDDENVFIFVVEIEKHDNFIRKGDDIIYKKEISLSDALTGVSFDLTMLDGKTINIATPEDLVVNPYSNHCINGLGLPIMNTKSYGNLIVEFFIQFPTKISEERKQILRKVLNNKNTNNTNYTKKNNTHYLKEIYKPNQSSSTQKNNNESDDDDDNDFHQGPGGKPVQCTQQ